MVAVVVLLLLLLQCSIDDIKLFGSHDYSLSLRGCEGRRNEGETV